jgi:HAD superfamily hydrolase (TIGR01509 family)
VNWAHFSARGELGDVEVFRAELRTRFRALFDEGLEVHDDAVEVHARRAAQGSAIAVVSSSTRDHIERVLDRAGVTGLVQHIVASGDTEQHKPAPDPYLAACVRLGVDPRRTVGVEDTTTGARSSRAAGLWTVAVRRAHAVPELAEHADVVVDRLRRGGPAARARRPSTGPRRSGTSLPAMDVTPLDVGLLVLRVGVGLPFALHGCQKLFGWFGGGGLRDVRLVRVARLRQRARPRRCWRGTGRSPEGSGSRSGC